MIPSSFWRACRGGCTAERRESHEDCGGWNGICRTGGRRLSGRVWQRRHLCGQRRGEGPDVAPRQDSHLRTGARRARQAQQVRRTADLHHRAAQGGRRPQIIFIAVGTPQGEDGSADLRHVHGRGPRHRQGHERLQGHRQQEHRAGRHRRKGARGRPPRDHAPLQRGQQPRVPEAGRGRRRLHEARSRRHRRRRSPRRRAHGRSCTSRSPAPARRSW